MLPNFARHLRNDRAGAFSALGTGCLVLLVMTMAMGSACAQPSRELVSLINDYRSRERSCDGTLRPMAGPLAEHAALSDVDTTADSDLQAALKERGYLAGRVQAITISGPGRAGSVLALLKQRYCRSLLDQNYTDIGVSRQGNTWRTVLARPVLSPDLADWPDAGREILRLTNQARAQARSCGNRQFGAAPPLAWAPELARASLVHSRDMAKQNYFRHRARDGSSAADRVESKGYAWRRVGENIAAGQGSAKQVVSAWVSSPHHCANLMDPGFTAMGAAYAVNADSDSTIYWTQVFATPR